MEAAARAKDWREAARLAAEVADDDKLVQYSLLAAFGRAPEGAEKAKTALQAGELLAARGHHAEALPLLERAQAFQQAGKSALALRQPLRAAVCFKHAGAWVEAVRCYVEAGRPADALRVAEEGVLSLGRTVGETAAGAARVAELNVARADLLLQLGRGEEAAALLRSLPQGAATAALLERAGLYTEAFYRYLELGLHDEAARAAARAPNRERLLAQIYLQTGRPVEAGHLLGKLGLAREAAQAFAAAGEWAWAASRWEAAGEPLRAADAYERAGRPQDAARCYEAAGALGRAAEAYLRTGSVEQAAAIHVRRGDRVEAAQTYLTAGDRSRAAALLIAMRPNEPGYAAATLLLVPLLIDEGFAEEALERLRRIPAGEGAPAAIERDYWEGRCLEGARRTDAATACFERVLAADAGYRDAAARLDRLWASLRPTARAAEAAPPAPRPAARADFDTPGARLAGRYEILEELGRGGMGRVYKAHDLELGEVVAIKTLLAPGDGAGGEEARLLREVQICRRISHPNVVRVYDVGRFDGGLFITMEYLEGLRLDVLMAKEAPLPFARIRTLVAEIAAGLSEAHGQGIVHRDLKPSNVIVTAGRAKILDFGIASMKGLAARLTQTGFVMGSPMYMSPEQVLGRDLDGRSDLYSLGVLAYILIGGREPYDAGDPNALVMKQLREPPPDVRRFRRETPPEWLRLLARLLAKKPERRYQTAQEVVDELARFAT
jgi:tetratricopeptide (TPR) repeat protein